MLAGERPDATETAAVRLRPVIHAKECVGFFFGQAQRGSSVYISTKRPSIAEGLKPNRSAKTSQLRRQLNWRTGVSFLKCRRERIRQGPPGSWSECFKAMPKLGATFQPYTGDPKKANRVALKQSTNALGESSNFNKDALHILPAASPRNS